MVEGITRPTLILDTRKVETNIDKMLLKAKDTGAQLVPHFKTHQSKEIGNIFKEKGVDEITVSSVQMAEYFVAQGWQNITIAFPFNRLEIGVINSFLDKGVKIKLLVTDLDTVNFLTGNITHQIDLFIEVDAGYGRSGISSKNISLLNRMAKEISKSDNTKLYGIYCHPGNTYHADSKGQIQSIWAKAILEMNKVKANIVPEGASLKIRMGDTPGCVLVEDMNGVDEIGPGNFVFFDLVMNYLDVCDEEDIAVAVACPIVQKHTERNELIIHGGAVHFSKDHLFDNDEQKFFGEMVVFEENGWSPIVDGAKLISLSQEHGVLRVKDELMDTLSVGDVVGFLPIHSCLTANLMRGYIGLDGKRIEHM